jgi:hypothetical protein
MRLFVFCLLLVTLTSCNKIDELLTFTINHQTTVTVESSSPLNLPVEITTPDISTNSDQTFQNNNTKADLVKDVKLDQAKLTVTNPASKTFSFLKSIHFYISTDANDEILVAYEENIPATATTVELIPTTERLDKYVKSSSYKLRTKMVMRETLTEDVDVKIDMKFKVRAEPL